MPSDSPPIASRAPRLGHLLGAAFEQARVAMIVTDPNTPDNPIVAANEAFAGLTGYGGGEVLGRNCRLLQGAETSPEEVQRIRRCVERREAGDFELLNYRRDGTPFWNALHIGPILRDDGQIAFVASQRDVTARVEARERERRRREELMHGRKNVFALISSIAHLMPEEGRSAAEFKRAFSERLHVLVAAHDVVVGEGAADVEAIARGALSGFGRDAIALSGPPVSVAARPALHLALMLHELADNAAQHGALSRDDGRVTLRWWEASPDGRAAVWFDWIETGGPVVTPSPDRGFGSTLLGALLTGGRRPDAGLDWAPGGLVCRGGIARGQA